jgi:hypothetical protein
MVENSASLLCWLGGSSPGKTAVIEESDPEEVGEVAVCTGTGDAVPEPKRRRVEEKRREGRRRVEVN